MPAVLDWSLWLVPVPCWETVQHRVNVDLSIFHHVIVSTRSTIFEWGATDYVDWLLPDVCVIVRLSSYKKQPHMLFVQALYYDPQLSILVKQHPVTVVIMTSIK